MSHLKMTPDLLQVVAGRFRALGERARLQILNALRDGELTVTELTAATGLGQANASRHLALLHTLGFVARRREGPFVHYRLADRDVFALCDIMCGWLEAETNARRRMLRGG